MIYLLVSIFGVISIITLKLFLSIDETKKYGTLKIGSLFIVAIGVFLLITTYLMKS